MIVDLRLLGKEIWDIGGCFPLLGLPTSIKIIKLLHQYISTSVKFLALDSKKRGNSEKFPSFIFRVEKKAIYLQSKILLINNPRYYY